MNTLVTPTQTPFTPRMEELMFIHTSKPHTVMRLLHTELNKPHQDQLPLLMFQPLTEELHLTLNHHSLPGPRMDQLLPLLTKPTKME
jgi:hypothetical protein